LPKGDQSFRLKLFYFRQGFVTRLLCLTENAITTFHRDEAGGLAKAELPTRPRRGSPAWDPALGHRFSTSMLLNITANFQQAPVTYTRAADRRSCRTAAGTGLFFAWRWVRWLSIDTPQWG